ncbi:hypothetical protein EV401DRAFT_1887831 [Pisolithus croceorrhizus]|nr:hypothetical protein EV401DRAFT_1887831 [Pisolithus croceorrhizus]
MPQTSTVEVKPCIARPGPEPQAVPKLSPPHGLWGLWAWPEVWQSQSQAFQSWARLPKQALAQAVTRTIQKTTKWKVATSAGVYEDSLTDADSNRGNLPPKKQLDDALTPLHGHSSVQDDISFGPTCTGPDRLFHNIRVINLEETEGPPKQCQAECEQVLFINEVSTLCCHMQAVHKAEYLKHGNQSLIFSSPTFVIFANDFRVKPSQAMKVSPAIPEPLCGVWNIEMALLGFMQLNNAHNGTCLGQAPYKVIQHVGISHKVGYVMCNNALNSDMMMQEFAEHLTSNTGATFNPKNHCVCHCMAHIINLSTQAFLAAHSKSKHFGPTAPETELLVAVQDGIDHNEVGLVCAIVVKLWYYLHHLTHRSDLQQSVKNYSATFKPTQMMARSYK